MITIFQTRNNIRGISTIQKVKSSKSSIGGFKENRCQFSGTCSKPNCRDTIEFTCLVPLDLIAETIDECLCISYSRYLIPCEKSGKVISDVWRVELGENLGEKHFALSAKDDNTLNWLKTYHYLTHKRKNIRMYLGENNIS